MTESIICAIWLAVALGILLDFIFGDPKKLPHPVRLIGWLIGRLEITVRRESQTKRHLRIGGITLAIAVPLITAILGFGILYGLFKLGRVWLFLGAVYLSYTAMGTTCLAREANRVAGALTRGLEAGRKRLAHIVGRDTKALHEEEVIKATIETVAENTTDGCISVMLYLFIGGPVLAYFFKAVSTLDSMIGYRNDDYRDIGWASAKLDDVMNYVPARISGITMALSAFICGLNGRDALRILKRDHANHLSPNCAWTEAAAAGALGIQLGGTHEYFGERVDKPSIGDSQRPAEIKDIKRMNRLMYTTVTALFLILCGVGYFLTYIIIR